MADQVQETNEDQVGEVPVDPWAAAFAALGEQDAPAAETAADTGGHGDEVPVADADQADQGVGSAQAEQDDGAEPEDLPGGPGDLGGDDSQQDEGLDWDGVGLSEDEIREYRESFVADIRERTIDDVVKAYIDRGVRHQGNRLGATINDPDVCKRDRDGVPRFYNPETGREFTGDNPRRQAQEWVDDYNRELADAFEKTCQDYSQKLLDEEGGRLAVIEFAPKYKALDPVRRSMFESIIEDYEVTDKDGNVVSYSCDLDKVLAAVNRQVKKIQERFAKQAAPAAKPAPTGPVLDTPSSNGGAQSGGKPQFKSIEEAMEWEQDQILAKMRGSKR